MLSQVGRVDADRRTAWSKQGSVVSKLWLARKLHGQVPGAYDVCGKWMSDSAARLTSWTPIQLSVVWFVEFKVHL